MQMMSLYQFPFLRMTLGKHIFSFFSCKTYTYLLQIDLLIKQSLSLIGMIPLLSSSCLAPFTHMVFLESGRLPKIVADQVKVLED